MDWLTGVGMEFQNPLQHTNIITVDLKRKESEIKRDKLLYRLDKKMEFWDLVVRITLCIIVGLTVSSLSIYGVIELVKAYSFLQGSGFFFGILIAELVIIACMPIAYGRFVRTKRIPKWKQI